MNDQVVAFARRVIETSHVRTVCLPKGKWESEMPHDLGLREGILGISEQTNSALSLLGHLAPNTIHHITDAYGCMYTAMKLPNQSDILLFGPYLEGKHWTPLLEKVSQEQKLLPEIREQLRDYYGRLPKLVIVSRYYSLVLELGKYLYGAKLAIRYHLLEQTNDGVDAPLATYIEKPIIRMQKTEERFNLENEILDALRHGNETLALQAMEHYGDVTDQCITEQERMVTVREHLIGWNTMFRKEAERASVHPLYLAQLSRQMVESIRMVKAEQEGERLMAHMIKRYCTHVKQYSLGGYSPVVRNVIRYSSTHLDDDLSLSDLAERFSINRTYLSTLFRQETGIALTEYINRLRISYAADLLASQQITVTDAAAMSGFSDASYFTKVFRRIMQQTPTQFMKNVHKANPIDNGIDAAIL